MAYTPTVWEDAPSTDTPINAANLNHLEQGVAAAHAALAGATSVPSSLADGVTFIVAGQVHTPLPIRLGQSSRLDITQGAVLAT